ncbi:MAG: SusD/RagB family nutrient-binding outer membrane lipoprotein [Ferruginibacter sp.]|nr:SusD/RagB family nutrient-binding outer membrane lipoprotein [Chitinophagaceae bacterium]
MKKLIIKLALTGVVASAVLSCSKKIDEAYVNPNTDLILPSEQLLPYVTNSMFANGNGHGPAHDARYIGAYVQNWFWAGVASNYDRMGYTSSTADVGQSMWRSHYYDIGQNNKKMIDWAIDEEKWDYAGVGKAIFAWSWLSLTDIYGDVILDDAFNTTLYTFKYNTQPEVYEYVRQLCFEALEYLNRTGGKTGNLAAGDAFFYNGDVNKWKKFVYGILARYHHHQSNKSEYKADSVIHYCNLSMVTNADNATVKYAATSITNTNNYYGSLRNNFVLGTNLAPTAFRQSAFIANLMSGVNTAFPGVNDPRAIYMIRLNTKNTFRGVELAKGIVALQDSIRPESFHGVSQFAGISAVGNDAASRYIFRNASPTPVLTASEIQFMKAEAAYRKGDKQTAYNAYREGIKLHFDLLMADYNTNVPAANLLSPAIRDAYLANPAVVPASFTNLTLTQIMLQKYIALWGHGVLETWVDLRRFHYIDPDPTGANPGLQVYRDFNTPNVPIAPSTSSELFTPDNGGKFVYRIRPRFNSEYIWNINELARIGALNLDYHTKRLWFSEP